MNASKWFFLILLTTLSAGAGAEICIQNATQDVARVFLSHGVTKTGTGVMGVVELSDEVAREDLTNGQFFCVENGDPAFQGELWLSFYTDSGLFDLSNDVWYLNKPLPWAATSTLSIVIQGTYGTQLPTVRMRQDSTPILPGNLVRGQLPEKVSELPPQ